MGLWQAFQLGLQDIRCHIVDALPQVGGQCVELYGNKPIYDIPGIPRCTGRELIGLLQQQVAPFAPHLHLDQTVTALQALADGRWQVQIDDGGGQWRLLATVSSFASPIVLTPDTAVHTTIQRRPEGS